MFAVVAESESNLTYYATDVRFFGIFKSKADAFDFILNWNPDEDTVANLDHDDEKVEDEFDFFENYDETRHGSKERYLLLNSDLFIKEIDRPTLLFRIYHD